MIVRNKDIYLNWKNINANNGYGFDIFAFVEKWANLMEEQIEKGRVLEEIANETLDVAGREELSNTMFDVSLNILYKSWIYGYELEIYFKKKRRGIFGEEV